MNINKISILFLLSKSRANKKGKCAIRCRITFQKQRKEFASGFFIEDENWNNKIQLAVGNNADYINSNLALIKQKLEQIQLEYSVLKSTYTVEDVFLKYIGKDTVEEMTLLKMFQFHIDRMKELIGIDFKPVTVQKYELIKTHVKSFIQWKYGKNDILLEQLKLNFLTEFEFYLKTKQKQKQTTINKAIQRVRTVVKTAIGEEYLSVDPFVLFKPKKSEYSLVFLSKQELKKLEEYQFKQKRLEQVNGLNLSLYRWTISPYGQVAGLGNVKKIPQKGWIVAGSGSIEDRPKVKVEVGKAYVLASVTNEIYSGLTSQASRMFVRLFIEGWITMDKVGVIGVTAKHQSPFRDPSINKFEVSTTSVKLLPTDTEHKLVEVTPFQTWSVKVEGVSTGVGIAITDEGNLQIGKFWGEVKKGIHKVRLSSEGFSDIIINVEVI